ncbi:uncharacterized protein TNCV_2742171 [Trichonephila clavipes]|nr:uncharacterized protein TNCV_2742171 [Trichonephila clavipes]
MCYQQNSSLWLNLPGLGFEPEKVQSNALPTRLSGPVANYACGIFSTNATDKCPGCKGNVLESPNEITENGTWQRRSNLELCHSYKECDIVDIIKVERIKWTGHVVRMDEYRTTKKVFNSQLISTRRKDKPNLRWIDGLEKDLLVSRTKNWKTLAGKRLVWKRLLEKA